MKKQTKMILYAMLIILTGIAGCQIKKQEVKGTGKTLNEIRFKEWKDHDWLDNEYIRTLRKYIDAYNRGEIEDSSLKPYKENIKGKFVVYDIKPFISGGLFISIGFLDMPETIFNAWVYSDVNEEKEIVTGYEFRNIMIAKEKTSFTKEDILRIIKEHPENKLW